MLKLDLQDIPDGFRWRSRLGHLTYSRHLPHEQLVAHARMITSVPLLGWSVVHEVSDESYEHTHFAWIYRSALDFVGARKFDICTTDGEVLHPHMQPKVSYAAMEQLFNEYHMGRKYDITTGKKMYTAPAKGPWQKLPPEFEWSREMMKEIVDAPTLQDAVVLAGVRPRSVMDVQLLRRDSEEAPKRFKHIFAKESFRAPLLPLDWRSLHIYGGTGIGKTKLACSKFENPLVIKPFNAIGCLEMLSRFVSSVHDGIIFDEVDLRSLTREQAIALVDFDEESVLSVRYTKIVLPAGVKKIFISNNPDIWPASDKAIGAIARRVTTYHALSKLY
jgi:hypothetical protein